ncbi:two component transcriptional regulator, LuxR family [Desulfovibrio sp. X2]|uniref:response regulator n=1 Tax=Desulfovibrio sp. X2 TaxID=941449 RepID=UPI000358A799|nr:response regulator transcription factor [Desulfovibrio sp. X2]EPR44540.1 two component transcriptional regulator, LuxR family [Desulfovibrio sp. X2]
MNAQASRPCRVLIVDDHQVVIGGIRSLLASVPGIEVAGEATSGEQAVELAEKLHPDIAIMDISMPRMNGVEATVAIRQVSPTTDIVIYTMHSDQRFILELFKAGISGHVLKENDPADLVRAVETVRDGGTYFTTVTPQMLLRRLDPEPEDGADALSRLSPREMEVFRLLADGAAVKEIAGRLCISPKTVETHKYNIMEKLKARTQADLTKLAIRHRVIKA